MNYFCRNILLFVFILIVTTCGLDCFISARLFHNTNRLWRSWNQVYLDTTDYDIVINGNSRAYGMYDPVALDTVLGCNSFNLGMDGSCINRQIIKYHKYVNLHNYPKMLIQNVDFMSLEKTVGYEREQFFPYFVFDRALVREMDYFEHFSWAEKYIPCYRYLGYYDVILEAFFHKNQKKWYEYLNKGYNPGASKWDGKNFNSIKTFDCSYVQETVDSFRTFIKEQKSHGVEVVFVYAPVYYAVWDKAQNVDSVYQFYEEIARENQVTILDYSHSQICNDTINFYNATHLNSIGAEKFSAQLAFDLDSLNIVSFK